MRLSIEKTNRAGVYIVRAGAREARIVAHVVNGRGVYGFDEERPDQEIESALARRSDRQLAELLQAAEGACT